MPFRTLRRFIRRNVKWQRLLRAAFPLFAVILLITVLFWYSIKRSEPVIAMLARAEVREYVILAVNEAVRPEIESGNQLYRELVTLERDNNGAVTALIVDMAKVNTLRMNLTDKVAENIVTLVDTDLSIHIGDLLGGVLFSGRGPKLPVRVQSVTDVTTRFADDFSDSGINQTRHKIALEITASVNIIIPGGMTQATVTTEVAVAETIIIGTVPNVYAHG